ncbi:MAG: hypothetical protein COT39_02285 [Parcubacteria group bacterium CG08_land_8_20_14_0_20_48_21]|nr:MAG: hypothetical protein AUK21_01510 [Parcubacteria group bacterium CG2_30_48_51]PIS32894.1 MAG: hypothetical protein COT39_02285 [Parcubacteria group bacterium CG08_land_8_20_14_0_20_48_21]PIW78768.1 MAG: hypothetical protein COZ99_04465 [Parcubacteria group bacterium CG_4_8_14_3_um_filter_48_16]PIY78263.1 MAG: hypothetical protein COY83_00925 [Parcubacteria group bacterium CG_4_10_14_0_8_um_filter_48_154]PIZ77614.1 MAG: hypothetical protein COY03_02310 [bacterium CG_4_10_14_0_2_um_filter_
MSDEKIKKSVSYKVLIKKDDKFFNVGTIVIKTYTGDILYTPSIKFMDDGKSKTNKEIEHISWHANGQVHFKHKGTATPEKYSIVQKNGERQKISEIGFQELIRDTIKKYSELPLYNKKVIDLDVVFDVSNYDGSVAFFFSIVSSKLIVAQYKGQAVPIKSVNTKEKRDGLGSTIRALGHHSGSADVILQYSLRKIDANNLRTNRQVYIPHDMKISKLNIKV